MKGRRTLVLQTGRFGVAIAAAALMLVLAGCDSDGTPRPTMTSGGGALCRNANLQVAFNGVGIDVLNAGSGSCAFSGHLPVRVPYWRLDGPQPLPPSGTLPAGGVLRQTYTAGASNTCPGLSMAHGVAPLEVSVEGRTYAITLPADEVYGVRYCVGVTADPPVILPAPTESAATKTGTVTGTFPVCMGPGEGMNLRKKTIIQVRRDGKLVTSMTVPTDERHHSYLIALAPGMYDLRLQDWPDDVRVLVRSGEQSMTELPGPACL